MKTITNRVNSISNDSNFSDIRIKEEVNELIPQDSLGLLLKLRGVSYKFKEPYSESEGDETKMGFIAQEVEKVEEFKNWVRDKKHFPTNEEFLALNFRLIL